MFFSGTRWRSSAPQRTVVVDIMKIGSNCARRHFRLGRNQQVGRVPTIGGGASIKEMHHRTKRRGSPIVISKYVCDMNNLGGIVDELICC